MRIVRNKIARYGTILMVAYTAISYGIEKILDPKEDQIKHQVQTPPITALEEDADTPEDDDNEEQKEETEELPQTPQ